MNSIDQIFLLLITVLPAIGILCLFVFLDKFVEPKKYVLITFALGALTIGPLYMFDEIIFLINGSPIEYSPFVRAFFSAAFQEELLKFCVLFFLKKCFPMKKPIIMPSSAWEGIAVNDLTYAVLKLA